ncbi:hypothetical protein SCHPADRAFT_733812 [Schizopora paradoxa]|uniref:Uncharacterized protein n=1 Tax=Schizopora paradoxa TaxID=27342 RepID=A0A0H2RK68_9AGAM|nr:hypothetical protein SCHPADRAFT_733812 [Schizopora paradoxa]
MAVANIVNFILIFATDFDYIETGAGNTSEVTHSISVIMASRMMLNIMEAADRRVSNEHETNDESTENVYDISAMHFTTHFNPEFSTIATSPLYPSIPGQRPSILESAPEDINSQTWNGEAGKSEEFVRGDSTSARNYESTHHPFEDEHSKIEPNVHS